MQRPSNKGNTRVAEGGQVLYRLADPVLIFDANVGNARRIRSHIHKDERYFAEAQMFQQRFFHSEGQNRHSVHPALNHAPHRRLHSLGVVHGGREQDFVVILDRKIFEGLNDFREKRIGDLGNNQAENAAPSRNQGAGLSIWIIAQLIHHLPDTLDKLRVDGGNPVHDPRYSGGGNSSFPRNLTDVHRSTANPGFDSHPSMADTAWLSGCGPGRGIVGKRFLALASVRG